MHSVALKRLTGFAHSFEHPHVETWVNPAQVAYCQPRLVTRGRGEIADGTRLFFSQDGGVVDVREPIGQVVALLQSGDMGLCRDCYQVLPDAWRTLCDDCRRGQHCGVDIGPEVAEVLA
jgi:hypothetical protein